jgi:hypothetical protein
MPPFLSLSPCEQFPSHDLVAAVPTLCFPTRICPKNFVTPARTSRSKSAATLPDENRFLVFGRRDTCSLDQQIPSKIHFVP